MAEQHEWMFKAEQCWQSAESEFANRRYDSAANRAYYACFQAALAALIDAGQQPVTDQGTWSHSAVQAIFSRELIHRRKIYPAALASILPDVYSVRDQADYASTLTSETQAKRALDKTRLLVATIQRRVRRKR